MDWSRFSVSGEYAKSTLLAPLSQNIKQNGHKFEQK